MSLNNNNQEAAMTREQRKSEVKEQTETMQERRKRIRIRLIPIWLRVVIITILIVGSATLGAIVGYSVMGGGKASDIFEKNTWTHITDLINKE